ncbi:DUF2314 domain-containing protein [Yoonia sp. R2331]|uniref:DUF2314 domain-containing protein n=1 Tax=Yoonia sp. R2331 TaxID=3237238 RepID=UPI0034E4B4F7
MLRHTIVAVTLTCAGQAHGQASGDPVTPFGSDDPTMNAAIAAAQKSLPLFLCQAVDDEGYGPGGGLLKVKIPVDHPEMTHEIIWVNPFAAWDGAEFAGLLANQPHALPGLNLGDQIGFDYDMIVDWAWYHPSGAQYGNYTTRVILEQQGDAASLDQLNDLAKPPFEADWTCS